jgi:hypothetical protein
MEPLKSQPGSPDAVAQGCTCSPTLNRHGKGTFHGQPRFYYARKCPVHRMEEASETDPRSGDEKYKANRLLNCIVGAALLHSLLAQGPDLYQVASRCQAGAGWLSCAAGTAAPG